MLDDSMFETATLDELPDAPKSKTTYHSIEEGDNVFRIYPAHPHTEKPKTSFEMKCVNWGSIMLQDGKLKRKSIFTSNTHATSVGRDVLIEYRKLYRQWLYDNIKDESTLKSKQAILDNNKTGITYSPSFICYADKIVGGKRVFGILDISEATYKKVKAAAFDLSDNNEDVWALVSDAFLVNIKRTKNSETGKSEYKALPAEEKISKAESRKIMDTLNQEQREQLVAQRPLAASMRNAFSKKDFQTELEMIRNFEKENEKLLPVMISESEKFQQIVFEVREKLGAYLDKYHPENEEAEDETPATDEGQDEDSDAAYQEELSGTKGRRKMPKA